MTSTWNSAWYTASIQINVSYQYYNYFFLEGSFRQQCGRGGKTYWGAGETEEMSIKRPEYMRRGRKGRSTLEQGVRRGGDRELLQRHSKQDFMTWRGWEGRRNPLE